MSQQAEQEKPAQTELLEEKFFFVRHGQTDANLAELAAGAGWDIELNATGLAQARALAESVAIEHFRSVKTICVSPMIRARQTAEIINEVIKAPVVEIEELREWHLGEWERRSWHELDFRVGNPPGGESNEEFASRVIKGLNHRPDASGTGVDCCPRRRLAPNCPPPRTPIWRNRKLRAETPAATSQR